MVTYSFIQAQNRASKIVNPLLLLDGSKAGTIIFVANCLQSDGTPKILKYMMYLTFKPTTPVPKNAVLSVHFENGTRYIGADMSRYSNNIS